MRARIVALIVGSLFFAVQWASAQEPGSFNRYSHTNAAGTMQFMVFTPPGPPSGGRGLVVFLHGAGFDGPRTAADTQFNELAAREGFVVLYPEVANSGCWGWASPEHQQRDAGQPSLVADITRKVIKDWRVNPQSVWVDGVSCGGAMANVMAATYPDLYAAVGAHASCPYKGSPCFGSRSLASDDEAARAIYQAMGSRARVMPFFAVVGSLDVAAPPETTEQTVRSWLGAADLADDGTSNQSVPRQPAENRSEQIPGGRAYKIAVYNDAKGCRLGERWLIENMSHAYSGGQNSDRPSQVMKSPDVTTASYRFFVDHPMAGAPDCAARSDEGGITTLTGDRSDQFTPSEPLVIEEVVPEEVATVETVAVPESQLAATELLPPRYPLVWLLPLAFLVVGGYLTHAITQPIPVGERVSST